MCNRKNAEHQLATSETNEVFSFALPAFAAQSSTLYQLDKIRASISVWTKGFPYTILILLQYSLEAFNVYHTLRSLMYESWPSPLPLKAFFYYDFLKRSLLKFWWNELRNSLHFQRIWIRVPCMNQAKRPQTSTLFVCSRWLKNVWSHMRERCTAGSAQKHLIILIWPKRLWGEKHAWFNTKNPNHFHISRTNNGANNYQYISCVSHRNKGGRQHPFLISSFATHFWYCHQNQTETWKRPN